jgi:hypothetical protein
VTQLSVFARRATPLDLNRLVRFVRSKVFASIGNRYVNVVGVS